MRCFVFKVQRLKVQNWQNFEIFVPCVKVRGGVDEVSESERSSIIVAQVQVLDFRRVVPF